MSSPKTKRSRSSLSSQTSSSNAKDITSLLDDSLSSATSLEICEPLVQEPSLKERPIAGQKIDICDPEKIWASGTIVSCKIISKEEYSHNSSIKRSRDEVDRSNCEYEVEVAYDGWGPEWNEKLRYPNSRIVRHFAFSRQVKAFVDIGAPKPKYVSSSVVEPILFWPCIVQIRMPTEGNQTSALFLELEKNVYVEPYLPKEIKILPELRRVFPNCHKQKHKGDLAVTGAWLQTKWLKPFREFDFTTFSNQQLLVNFPLSGFISAYEEALADKTTPGTLPKRLFAKGSLVNLCFRGGTNYTGAFCDESPRKPTATSSIHNNEPAKEKPIVESRNNYTKPEHPVPPPKLPPSIRIAENLYPKTTRCSSEDDNSSPQWFGIIVTGGSNELIVGKFPSQTEAHEAAIRAMGTCHKNDACLSKADVPSTSIATDLNPEIHVQRNDPDTNEVILDAVQHPQANVPCISTPSPVAATDKGDFVLHKNEEVDQPLTEASAEEILNDTVNLIGEYKVYIPITEEGMLMRIAPPSKSNKNIMPGFDAIFEGFRRFSDGRKSEPELKNLIHGIGDWIVQVDNVSTKNMTFKQVMGLITEKKKKNPCGMTLTFLDCNNKKTLPSETIADCIDLTNYDDEEEMMDIPHICNDVADGEMERKQSKSTSLSRIMEPVIDLSLECPTDECAIDIDMRDVPKMATKDVPSAAMKEECSSKGNEEKVPAAATTPRQIEINTGREQDIRKISLEAVVAAAESMLDPSLHTFIMQEWTIELIRHKAYLKEVTNNAAAANLDEFSTQQCTRSLKDEGVSKSNRKSKPRRLLV